MTETKLNPPSSAWEDKFTIQTFLVKTVTIDASRSRRKRIEDLTQEAAWFAAEDFYNLAELIYTQKLVKEEKERQAAETRRLESQRQRAINDTPIARLCKTIRTRQTNPELLNVFTQMPNKDLRKLYAEFDTLTKKRGIPLSAEDIDYTRNFLIASMNKPEPTQSLLDRLKNKLTKTATEENQSSEPSDTEG